MNGIADFVKAIGPARLAAMGAVAAILVVRTGAWLGAVSEVVWVEVV